MSAEVVEEKPAQEAPAVTSTTCDNCGAKDEIMELNNIDYCGACGRKTGEVCAIYLSEKIEMFIHRILHVEFKPRS